MKDCLASYDIYLRLYLRIISLSYIPGQYLDGKKMCTDFQTSRTPVRDAYCVLDQGDLVRMEPQVGTFVTMIDDSEAETEYEMFMILSRRLTQLFRDHGEVSREAMNNLHQATWCLRNKKYSKALQNLYQYSFLLARSCMGGYLMTKHLTDFGNLLRLFSANLLVRRLETEVCSFCLEQVPLLQARKKAVPLSDFLYRYRDCFNGSEVRKRFPEFFSGFRQKWEVEKNWASN